MLCKHVSSDRWLVSQFGCYSLFLEIKPTKKEIMSFYGSGFIIFRFSCCADLSSLDYIFNDHLALRKYHTTHSPKYHTTIICSITLLTPDNEHRKIPRYRLSHLPSDNRFQVKNPACILDFCVAIINFKGVVRYRNNSSTTAIVNNIFSCINNNGPNKLQDVCHCKKNTQKNQGTK